MSLLDYDNEPKPPTVKQSIDADSQKFIDAGLTVVKEQGFLSRPTDDQLITLGKKHLGKDKVPGDFIPGVKRGVEGLKSSLYGGAALASDIVGFEAGEKWGMEGYKEHADKAAKYPKKHTFKDVYTGKAGIGGTADWIQSTFGELLPSMIEAAVGAAIGSAVAPGPGTAVGGLGARTILRKSIDKLVKEGIEAKIKKGVLEKGTEKLIAKKLKDEVTRRALMKLGARVGIGAAVLPIEAGGNYGELLSEYGVKAPLTSLAFGGLATAVEFVGGNSGLVDVFIDAIGKNKGSLIKRTAKNLLNNIPAEALQEGTQGALSILNIVVNTDEKLLTVENLEQIIEDMGAGAVGGAAGATVMTAFPGGKGESPGTKENNRIRADIESGILQEAIDSGALTSEIMTPVIERLVTQDPELAMQISSMFAVKETNLTANEKRFEENPLDAENNIDYLNKYIRKAELPGQDQEAIARRQAILDKFSIEPEEKKLTDAERRQERIDAIYKQETEIEKPSDAIRRYLGDGSLEPMTSDRRQEDILVDQERRRAVEKRRTDAAMRKTVNEMTPDEMKTELKTDYLTGLGNKRAYDESIKKPVQTSIDVDSLKWTNDNFGHESGDVLLKHVGSALKDSPDACRVSGDEFALQGETAEEIDAAVQKAYDYLDKNPIDFTDENGNVISRLKGSFSYGTGQTAKEADEALRKSKADREVSGDRAARGEKPPGFKEVVPEGAAEGAQVEQINTERQKNVKQKYPPHPTRGKLYPSGDKSYSLEKLLEISRNKGNRAAYLATVDTYDYITGGQNPFAVWMEDNEKRNTAFLNEMYREAVPLDAMFIRINDIVSNSTIYEAIQKSGDAGLFNLKPELSIVKKLEEAQGEAKPEETTAISEPDEIKPIAAAKKDLPKKLASKMTADEMLAEWDKQAEELEAPPAQEKTTAQRKVTETRDHLSNAADAFKAINDILGEKGAIYEGVDEAKWNKIKPLLKTAFDEIIAAGKSGAEFVAIALKSLSPKGKPYFEKFVKEEMGKEDTDVTDNLRGGKIQKTTGADDTGKLKGERSKDVPGVKKGAISKKVLEGDRTADDVSVSGRMDESGDEAHGAGQKAPNSAGSRTGDVSKGNLGGDAGNVSGLQRADYIIKPRTLERQGSWKDAAKNNLDAIELLKKIESEKRPATLKEQQILAKYVGWGASELANKMFPGYSQYGKLRASWADDSWKNLVERIEKALTPKEIKTAAKSTQYAHYTNEPIITSIYKALNKMGFKGGKILEPGMGIGNFVGLLPVKMRKASNYTGIEMDIISAGIAKLLYPSQNMLQANFIEQKIPKNFFDAAIGNPPFGSGKIIVDPEYRKHRFSLHNYFFAKAIDRVRPGGLLVFVTSRYAMDAKADKARQYIANKADLIGAIRLPQTAFLKSAGTEVVTDVLFLQKKEEGAKKKGEAWEGQKEIMVDGRTALINEYFAVHPEMVLGSHSFEGSMYGADQYTVKPIEGEIEVLFDEAAKNLPENIYKKVSKNVVKKYKEQSVIERDFNPKNKKEGGTYLSDDGHIMRVEFGSGVSIEKGLTAKTKSFLKSYIKLRDVLKVSHKAQLDNTGWEKALENLNKEYDQFVKKQGNILIFTSTMRTKQNEDGTTEKVEYRNYKNEKLLRMDCESSLIMTLEGITKEGEIVKSRVLQGRTINKPTTKVIKTVPDALAVSLDTIGVLDIDHVARVADKPQEEIITTLGNLIYDAPDGTGWVMADEYLSGNVVRKLSEAKIAAETNPDFKRNVSALEKSQPVPLKPSQISITPGATWIPINYYSQFATEVLELPETEVTYQPIDNSWKVGPAINARSGWRRRGKEGYSPQELRDTVSEWGTAERGANEIFDSVLNNRTIRITYTVVEGESKKTVFDAVATAAANEIANGIRQRFNSWAWEDSDRANTLIDIYNTKINVIKGREFDGSHLTLPGMSQYFTPYDHQKRVIWRILQTGNTYMAHAVGAGKTFIMISAGMEMRRLGMINKPLYVVPKHMLGQFSQEFQELYPMSNILIADEKNFHTENRKRFIAQAALNDPDAVILTHSSFGLLGIKEETLAPVRDEFLTQMRFSLSEMEDEDEPKMKIKRMEKRIEQTEQRFNSLLTEKDSSVSFEELGADFMFVDEAHEFRKLDFVTNRQMKGIDPQGSKRAIDLYIKTLWMERQRPGRSHAFASGTPIVNTLGELYSLQKFFDRGEMEEDGINHFDAWANMFGEPATTYEMTASGKYEPVERFSRFINIPELMSRIKMFMDVLTDSQLGTRVDRPKIKDNKAEIVLANQNDALREYQNEVLQPRIKASREWRPTPDQPGNPDPIINIITDGKLASIDMRFVDRMAANDTDSKLNKWVDGIISTYKETKSLTYATEYGKTDKSAIKGGCQICFYNNGFGSGVIKRRGFESKAFVMKRFKEANIPAKQIGWIDDYKTAPEKQALFKLVRNGEKRILLGSAKKMGTGVNVQERLTHLHYLDAPWYPADVEQPDGRIVRQGNQNAVVGLVRYATKGSYDATLWQMVARKAKAIEQAFAGDENIRAIEDISESSQYEMASALASGDERIVQLATLRADIERLHLLKSSHKTSQRTLAVDKRNLKIGIETNEKELEKIKSVEGFFPEYIGAEIDAKVGDEVFTERKKFGAALIKQIKKIFENKNDTQVKLGTINGIEINTGTILMEGLLDRVDIEIAKKDFFRDIANTYMSLAQWNETDAVGLTKKITNTINSFPSIKVEMEQSIEDDKKKLIRIEKRLGAPFEHSKEAAEKNAEAATLEQELVSEGEVDKEEAADKKAFSVKFATVKPQETITKKDLREFFSGMKNITTGISLKGNFYFKVKSGKAVEILEVDHINGYINTSSGRIPVGSFLKNIIELKTKGKGATADIATIFHEFTHYLEANGIITGNDIKALNRAITASQGISEVTEENRADYVGNKLATWQSEKNLRIKRILKKIVDFMNAIYEFVAQTRVGQRLGMEERTARGVLRDVSSGKILGEKETRGITQFAKAALFEGMPLFQMAGEKAIGAPLKDGKSFDNHEQIWEQYAKAMGRRRPGSILDEYRFSDYLEDYAKIFKYKNSYIVGQEKNGIFKPSHFAPASIREGAEAITELSKYNNIIFAVTEDLSSMLEHSGYYISADATIPQIFSGGLENKIIAASTPELLSDVKYAIKKFKETGTIPKGVLDLVAEQKEDDLFIEQDFLESKKQFSLKEKADTTDYADLISQYQPEIKGTDTDIIKAYKEKHIAFEPKKLQFNKQTFKDFAAKVYTKFVFAEYPAIRLALKGKDPKATQRVQDQINKVWGKGGIVEVFAAGKGPHRIDTEGKPVYIEGAQSLKEIVKDLNPQEYEDYETLRIAERDVALARFRPDVKATDLEASTQLIEAIERKYGEGIKKLRDASKAHIKYDDTLLQLLVEEGWLSKKVYEGIKARPESEFYASFMREMDTVGEQVHGGKDPLKKIKGSELRKIPTIESSVANTYKTIKLLETIKLNKSVVALKDLTPDLAEVIKEVQPHYIPVKQTLEAEVDPKMRGELNEVTKSLGATVETLKNIGSGRMGQFVYAMNELGLTQEETNRIELKFATSEKTYAHELGHLIDRKFGLQSLLIKGKGDKFPVIKKELRQIADQRAADDTSAYYKKYIRQRDEQVAEFVSRYLTQPDQAKALAPTAVKKLEEFFASKPQLKKLLTIKPSGQATLSKMSDVVFAKSPIAPKNTIIVPVNGVKHFWQVPPDVHKSIDYYSPQEMSMVIKILSGPARLLRAGATLTAEFIMRNPVRDQFSAMVYSKYGYIPFIDFGKGFFELMKKGDLYQEFKAGGGEQSYFTSMDRTTLNMTAKDIVGFKKGLKTYNPIEYLRIASEAMEKATRLGVFKKAREKDATVPEAIAAARESTLDFRRIGEERRINQIIAFWNANVQGTDIMRRKIQKHPGRTLLRLGLGITVPSIALWLFNNSDDDRKEIYNSLPGWRKNFFWNFIIDKDTPIISLPKPFELGLIFGSLPERILDYIALNDPAELKTIIQSIKDGAMPGTIPTAALPILENMTNWSFFMERPVESPSIRNLPPGQRSHQYTSTALKEFGKATNISPIKMENWIRGWTGGLGKLGLDIIDPLFETDKIPKVSKKWYEVTPGIKGFIAKEPIGGRGKDITNFYNSLEKITQAEQGYKSLLKTNIKEATKFNKKTNGIKRFAASFRRTSLQLGKLRKRKIVISQSRHYSSDKKRRLVDRIDTQMTKLAKFKNEQLKRSMSRQSN